MVWERAEDLAVTLLGKGRSEGEVIKKLCETTDRYRGRYKECSDKLTELKKEIIQLKKDAGQIIQISVEMIQHYGFQKVVWYNGKAYRYSSNGVWVAMKKPEHWPDLTYYGSYKVWIELHESDRDVVCKGVTKGFVNGMTCITLEPETQRKMFLNSGDEVTVTKVRKKLKG